MLFEKTPNFNGLSAVALQPKPQLAGIERKKR
jgi:hypothetical protein